MRCFVTGKRGLGVIYFALRERDFGLYGTS